jgi:hypothetical protein
MNVKVPAHVLEAIDRMATELDTTKTAIVIALLEAALERGEKIRKKFAGR